MAVAYVQFHWKLAIDAKFFPAVNQGELALLYSVLFLFVACRGGGRWSLDERRTPAARTPQLSPRSGLPPPLAGTTFAIYREE